MGDRADPGIALPVQTPADRSGEPKDLTKDNINHSWAHWFPDGRRILFSADEPGKGVRFYVYELASGKSQAISEEGVNGTAFLDLSGLAANRRHRPRSEGISLSRSRRQAALIAGLNQGEQPITWSADGHSLYIYQPGELPARVYRLDIKTGQRALWKELMPSDPAGVENIGPILMTPDAKTCVFGYHRMLADLYLVEGLK